MSRRAGHGFDRRSGSERRRGGILGALVGALAVLALILSSSNASAMTSRKATVAPAPAPTPPGVVTLGSTVRGRPMPDGFVGLSLEYRALLTYLGSDPSAINPVFLRLLRNLGPGQDPVIRIGGDSTDWTWWPVPKRPTAR